MDKELHELNKRLEQKESEMKLFGGFDTMTLKQHFGKKIVELEDEKRTVQHERNRLLAEVENLSCNSDGQKLQEVHSQKLKGLEAQVQLQHKIKQEAEQFRQWKASGEKELLQLKKEGRRNEYERHKLQALNQRQKMVLQRKTEEAAMATKRLKDLLEARKFSTRDNSGNQLKTLFSYSRSSLECISSIQSTIKLHKDPLKVTSTRKQDFKPVHLVR
ncbi:hypothetical protein AgCh_028162 [Apium graveolens]